MSSSAIDESNSLYSGHAESKSVNNASIIACSFEQVRSFEQGAALLKGALTREFTGYPGDE
jgi:hypothetical protein